MLRTRVMPCLLLERGRLVKTVKFDNASYVGDPINAIRIYNDKEVDDLLVLDIGAGPGGAAIDLELMGRIASECFMPFTYGGGIRSLEQIKAVFAIGVEKIAVNRMALEDESFISRAADRFGSQSIVVSIDVRRPRFRPYEVFADRGRRPTGVRPVEFARRMERMGAGEILLNSIDRDGTMEGYDLELIKAVATSVGIPVIACGGAGRVSDLPAAVDHGAAAVALGSMAVYQGRQRAVLINFPSRDELRAALLPIEQRLP
jgi:cyclase